MLPDDINLWYVRNSSGTMVPFSAFATSRWETGVHSRPKPVGSCAASFSIMSIAVPVLMPGAASPTMMLPDDINLWYVRNSSGTMVPFSAFATSRWETGSPRLAWT
jgi:multidrug efflux pump subunit AcrB